MYDDDCDWGHARRAPLPDAIRYVLFVLLFVLLAVALWGILSGIGRAAEQLAFTHAALTPPPASTIVSVGGVWDALTPAIVALLGAILTALAGWIATKLRVKLDRDTYQSALATAAGYFVQMAGSRLEGVNLDVKSPALATAIRIVQNSAPGALKRFGITEKGVQIAGKPSPSTGPFAALPPLSAVPPGMAKAAVEQLIGERIIANIPKVAGGPALEAGVVGITPMKPLQSPADRNAHPNR
jgi:hypothetical protein